MAGQKNFLRKFFAGRGGTNSLRKFGVALNFRRKFVGFA